MKTKTLRFGSIKLIIFFLLIPKLLLSQSHQIPSKSIELKTHYCFLMTHHKHMSILAEQHFPIYQLSYVLSGEQGKNWNSLYNYPQYGFSFLYSPLSSPTYIGKGIAALTFINFPIYRKNKFSFNFFIGTGVGYIEKPFHIHSNFKNQAIGSHLNTLLCGQFELKHKLSQQSEISCGVSLTHFSNGKIKTPNLGINNTGVFLGYSYSISSKNENIKNKDKIEDDSFSKWEKNLFLAGAIKQNYPVGGDYYFYSAFSFNIKKRINNKRKFGAGIDIFYDFSDKAAFNNKGFDKPSIAYTKPALYLAHDYVLGDLSIIFHLGTYLYAFENNQNIGMVYDRIGIQYFFNSSLSTQVALKTHYAKADCIEFGINYSF